MRQEDTSGMDGVRVISVQVPDKATARGTFRQDGIKAVQAVTENGSGN